MGAHRYYKQGEVMNQTIGSWAFILGVLIAIIAGLAAAMVVEYAAMITLVLIILGLIVGFLNINDKETQPFLVATIALMAVKLSLHELDILNIGAYLTAIVGNLAAFVAPAALILALKAIYKLGKTPAV